MKLMGSRVPPDTLFLARILDDFNLLLWSFSKNANNGNKPKPIAESLLEKPKKEKELMSFKTGADFDKKWAEITQRINSHKHK